MLKWKVWSQIYLCDIIITGPCAHANCLQVRARTPASRAPHVRLTCTTTRMANFIVMALWDEMVAMGLSSQGRSSSRKHTVAIWTFTFHKISGFVWVILKANFKEFCRPKVSIQIYYSHFPSFFVEFVKSTAFYTLLLLFQRVDMFELRFDAKIAIQTCQLWNLPSKSPLQSLMFCEM